MLVIADASPLIVLLNMQHIAILPQLFGQVMIPPAVCQELAHSHHPQVVRDFAANPPPWIVVKSPVTIEPITGLHAGELAAISLARESHADLLLIDETRGRRAAAARNIKLTGTLGVIERAADANLLDLADAFDKLKQTTFWVSTRLLDERLKGFLQRKKGKGAP